MCAQDDNPC